MRNDFSENTASGRVTSAMPEKNKGLTITCKFGIHQESGIDMRVDITGTNRKNMVTKPLSLCVSVSAI